METVSQHSMEGRLQISSEAIEKIARHAALEVDGVAGVRLPSGPAGGLRELLSPAKPIRAEITGDVADVEISLVVQYGASIPDVGEKVQQNVKSSIQNMTSVPVGRVNVTVVGIAPGKEVSE